MRADRQTTLKRCDGCVYNLETWAARCNMATTPRRGNTYNYPLGKRKTQKSMRGVSHPHIFDFRYLNTYN